MTIDECTMGLSESIGNTISYLRLKKGRTQEEVAAEAGISRNQLSVIENGDNRVSVWILHKIAKGLGVSLIELLEQVKFDGIREYYNPDAINDDKKVQISDDLTLFYRGDESLLKSPNRVTIIGKKKPTEYGLKMSQAITSWFVNKGYTIVSGIEEGIDSMVQESCLKSGGKSIAVINSGLRGINNKSSKELANKIVDAGGLLLSKYPAPSFPKISHNMDSRMIQVGISRNLILVESQLGSCEMKVALKLIKEKKKITCVQPRKKDLKKAQGNMILIRDHQDMVMELTQDSIIG